MSPLLERMSNLLVTLDFGVEGVGTESCSLDSDFITKEATKQGNRMWEEKAGYHFLPALDLGEPRG